MREREIERAKESTEEVEREVEEDGDEERRRGRWLVAESISRAELNLRHRGSFGDATNFPNGGFPLGRARIQGILGVLHGNPTNSPTADNQETDLPCVAYIFTLFYFPFFFSPFTSFYPSFPSWKLPIRFSSYRPLYPLLSPFFFRFVSLRSRSKRGKGRNNTSSLQHRRSNFPSAKLILTCLLYKLVPIYAWQYAYIHRDARVNIDFADDWYNPVGTFN